MSDSSKKSLSEVEVQNHVADFYVEKRYKNFGLKYHALVIKQMMQDVHGHILDLGCGTGIIHDLYPNLDIIGVDISPGMLAHHKGKHQIGSAEKINFKDESFDSVICRSILHHLPNCHIALKEIKRVLKPGGRFVCWETNKSWLAELIRHFTQHGDHFSDYHHSFDNLPDLVRDFLHIDSVKYQGYIGYPLYGFPDIIRLDTFIRPLFRPIMAIDELLGRIPIINKLAFAVMIKGHK